MGKLFQHRLHLRLYASVYYIAVRPLDPGIGIRAERIGNTGRFKSRIPDFLCQAYAEFILYPISVGVPIGKGINHFFEIFPGVGFRQVIVLSPFFIHKKGMAGFNPGLYPGNAVQLSIHGCCVKRKCPVLCHGLLCLIRHITVIHISKGLKQSCLYHLMHLCQGYIHHIRQIPAGQHQIHSLVILFLCRQKYIFDIDIKQLSHFGAPETVLIIRSRCGSGNACHGCHLHRFFVFSKGISLFRRLFSLLCRLSLCSGGSRSRAFPGIFAAAPATRLG